ncbi:MAG: endo-1,4-beta-xylanase, partial [Bacteroidaceae bacterium]|nr:endo-1,4-beta-xylanase [Bacteroidaceae bacterium]
MKKLLLTATLAVACATSAFAQFGRQQRDNSYGLKDTYKDYFKVGVALNNRNLDEASQKIILTNYNSVTCENAMKSGELHPKENEWKWEQADQIADFCRKNNIKMRGHCLVWHSQFCDWMFTDNKGKEVSKEVFYKRLREHIHTVVNRYKDVVYCWDVVNEAMADGNGGGPRWGNRQPSDYRESRLYKTFGDEFIAKAFEFAHEADPNAILFYNDYNAADPAKRDRIYNMVKKMQDAGVPITGIGMQGHYNIYGPSMEDVEAAIVKYSQLVKHIHFTELDIRANQEMGGQLQFSREGVAIKDHVKAMHTDQYVQLFKVLRK